MFVMRLWMATMARYMAQNKCCIIIIIIIY